MKTTTRIIVVLWVLQFLLLVGAGGSAAQITWQYAAFFLVHGVVATWMTVRFEKSNP